VLLLAIAGTNQNKETATSSERDPPADKEDKEEKKTPQATVDPRAVEVDAGETAELRDRTLVANEVERDYFPPGRTARRPQPENEFLRVYITLENTSNQSFDFNPNNFMIQDSNGVQHRGQALSELPYPISHGTLASGGTLTGNLVFEVPRGDSGLSLVYEPFEKRNVGTVTMSL
jgi:hypothetical protein